MGRARRGRKLLVASVGVAAVTYGCKDFRREPVGNLMVVDTPGPDAAAQVPGHSRADGGAKPEPPASAQPTDK